GTYFYAFDGNGNVTALVNAADASIAAQYENDAFGGVIRMTGLMAKANPFRFSTKFQDDESGLVYFGIRHYSSVTGRWLSRDPLDIFGGLNLLAAHRNNPMSFVDLVGLNS